MFIPLENLFSIPIFHSIVHADARAMFHVLFHTPAALPPRRRGPFHRPVSHCMLVFIHVARFQNPGPEAALKHGRPSRFRLGSTLALKGALKAA